MIECKFLKMLKEGSKPITNIEFDNKSVPWIKQFLKILQIEILADTYIFVNSAPELKSFALSLRNLIKSKKSDDGATIDFQQAREFVIKNSKLISGNDIGLLSTYIGEILLRISQDENESKKQYVIVATLIQDELYKLKNENFIKMIMEKAKSLRIPVSIEKRAESKKKKINESVYVVLTQEEFNEAKQIGLKENTTYINSLEIAEQFKKSNQNIIVEINYDFDDDKKSFMIEKGFSYTESISMKFINENITVNVPMDLKQKAIYILGVSGLPSSAPLETFLKILANAEMIINDDTVGIEDKKILNNFIEKLKKSPGIDTEKTRLEKIKNNLALLKK